MTDNRIKWLWLTLSAFGTDITMLLEHYENIDSIYAEKEYADVPEIKSHTRAKLKNKNTDYAQKVLRATEDIGGRVITFDDIDYPDSLRGIDNPPYVLYVKGVPMKWDRLLTIGVVGTRSCTDYGISATRRICTGLAEAGVTVVSGMARGIDSQAAKSALAAGSKTIAVLGCGLDIVYPSENAALMKEISENGAVITEYPPGTRPDARNFPIRNRIISGLSRGLLVVEAPIKSGALISAEHALEQGRDIFSVPGSIFRENCAGTNKLLTNMAKPVTCAEDILSEYVYETERLEKPKIPHLGFIKKKEPVSTELSISVNDKKYEGLGDNEKRIVELLIESNMHIDELSRKSGIEMQKLMPVLSILEFGGYIRKIPGNNYKLNI